MDEMDEMDEPFEPDSYMMDYHPHRKGKNPLHSPGSESQTLSYIKAGYLDINSDRRKAFCTRVYKWLKQKVAEIEGPVTIAIAPGHEKNASPSGFMHDIVEALVAQGKVNDGQKQLIRTKTVPKQSRTPGLRNPDTHKGTIKLNEDKDVNVNNTGQTVIILDDVCTSGSTLQVCAEVILQSKPKDVKLFTIGKTV